MVMGGGGGVRVCCCFSFTFLATTVFVPPKQEVKEQFYDNFVKRGYSIDDIDGTSGKAVTSLRQTVRAAVYEHRRNPEKAKLGANKYAEIRRDFPKCSGVQLPAVDEDAVIRGELFKLAKACENASMRRRPEIAQWLLSEFEPALSDTGMNCILDIFLRCNARNSDQLQDLWCFMQLCGVSTCA